MALLDHFWRKAAIILLWASTLAVCTATVIGFLARLSWLLELTSHFRVQYFFLLVACASVFAGSKRLWQALVPGSFALVNLALIVPLYVPPTAAPSGGASLRILSVNVYHENRRHDEILKLAREVDADFVLLIEVDSSWRDVLLPLQKEYPYSQPAPMWGSSGIAFFSRRPPLDARLQDIGANGRPSVIARFDIDGVPLTILGTHPVSPTDAPCANLRNVQLRDVGRFAAGLSGEVMIVGDFNVTSWSPYFQDLLRESHLRDSRLGFGIEPSWPSQFPPLGITIDHCLVSSGIHILNRTVGRRVGSDHYPVIVDFSLDPTAPRDLTQK